MWNDIWLKYLALEFCFDTVLVYIEFLVVQISSCLFKYVILKTKILTVKTHFHKISTPSGHGSKLRVKCFHVFHSI